MNEDYYKILGVDKIASQDEIKKAFHKLAHKHHPDKSGGDVEKFKEINTAYQVLGNKEKRAQYDQFGSAFSQNGGFSNGQGFGGFQGGQWNINMDDLGDIFSNFGGIGDIFGFSSKQRRSSSAKNRRGNDLEMIIVLDFFESAFGVEKTIKLEKNVVCEQCNGSGGQPGSKMETCSECGGKGRINKVQRTIFGAMQVQTICPKCEGEGKIHSQVCSKCSGQGRRKEKTEFNVKIPAGIDNGETIRLSGHGEAGEKGAESGDLYLRVKVKPSPDFQRKGSDLFSTAQINLTKAVLGGKVEVRTIDGLVDLKIPEGCESGKVFVLRDKGLPNLHGRKRGDQFVTVEIKIPKSLSRNQKKLLEELVDEGL